MQSSRPRASTPAPEKKKSRLRFLLALPLAAGLAFLGPRLCGKPADTAQGLRKKIGAVVKTLERRNNPLYQARMKRMLEVALGFSVLNRQLQNGQPKTAQELVDCLLEAEQRYPTEEEIDERTFDLNVILKQRWLKEQGCLDYWEFLWNYVKKHPDEETQRALLDFIFREKDEYLRSNAIDALLSTIFQHGATLGVSVWDRDAMEFVDLPDLELPSVIDAREAINTIRDLTDGAVMSSAPRRDFSSSTEEARAALYDLIQGAMGDEQICAEIIRELIFFGNVSYTESEREFMQEMLYYAATLCGEGRREIPVYVENTRVPADRLNRLFDNTVDLGEGVELGSVLNVGSRAREEWQRSQREGEDDE